MPTPDTAMNLQKNVRKYIFEHFEEHAIAPVLEQIMQKFGLDRASAFNVLVELQSARHIALLPGTQRILMAFPFSSIVTPFRVRIAGKDRDHFANCAWDAVAIHVALGKEQWITSHCHHCAEDIQIHLRDQRMVSQGSHSQPLIYLALPAARWWENIVLTCSNNMVFFSSKDHLADWMKTGSVAGGEALTVDQTLRLSVPIYKEKMSRDYARPSREQTIAHFQSLGLTGDFWKICYSVRGFILCTSMNFGMNGRFVSGITSLSGLFPPIEIGCWTRAHAWENN